MHCWQINYIIHYSKISKKQSEVVREREGRIEGGPRREEETSTHTHIHIHTTENQNSVSESRKQTIAKKKKETRRSGIRQTKMTSLYRFKQANNNDIHIVQKEEKKTRK